MDMGSAHGFAQFFLNSHSWYHIDTTADYVRATIWCLSNFATGISYFLIPVEIREWRLVLPFRSTALIGTLFILFIAFCGASHLTMLIIMQTAPWWATLLIYMPMALVSIATVLVIRRDRDLIIAVLKGVGKAIQDAPN